ncbi:MAG: winged helix-turn-helix transcriptional regulator [Phycisphaerales bacterium]|nr:winged helix-turn-helix transcriptional regulator [Phycisphaerales bacterium]
MIQSARSVAPPGKAKLLSRLGAALGHPGRVQILAKLLEGPATYATLVRITRMKAGPLYHHVNQLRLAGLIRPKQRDLYLLTRGGRNVLLLGFAMCQLGGDRRMRPEFS